MKTKLKVGKVFSGAVWPAGSEIDEKVVPADELKKLVDTGEAEMISAPARVTPVSRPENDK